MGIVRTTVLCVCGHPEEVHGWWECHTLGCECQGFEPPPSPPHRRDPRQGLERGGGIVEVGGDNFYL
mgnify:FL=1